MKVGIAGLWHLGTVTAACCAAGGHQVIAFDENRETIAGLQEGRLPVEEPGLAELVSEGVTSGRLCFTWDTAQLASADVVWICYDTPVDENDRADVEYVLSRVRHLLASVTARTMILISSQMPVGTTARLKKEFPEFEFAYSPENLRLGKAIQVFRAPDRVVAGVANEAARERIRELFAPFTDRIEWMSVPSAEMTKHALNSFLATSVAFINELATLCEKTGADAQEVERGLKTDVRIGSGAYLHPGGAFAGGTLARDVTFLTEIGRSNENPARLLEGVLESNSLHKRWIERRLSEALPDLSQGTIAVLGLTYKPGTNTLRRSTAVEICRWLASQGATVQAYDPAVKELEPELTKSMQLKHSAREALNGADALVVATPWPEFHSLEAGSLKVMRRKLVIDPGRFLEQELRQDGSVEYVAIGVGS